MGRLSVYAPTKTDKAMAQVAESIVNRMQVASDATCPVETAVGFFKLCASQSCGKCTPCRVGLRRLADELDAVLAGTSDGRIMEKLTKTCETLYETADCAIGFQAGRVGMAFLDLLTADVQSHLESGRCSKEFTAVPCVAGCPSHVDIPAYVAMVKEGRYEDAVRIIRNDNPFPSACAFVCEHPCENTCRRGMIDSPINIRGMKKQAVECAGAVEPPAKAPASGKKVGIVGGGPSGLTCAYYLALMGHEVTVYEMNDHLGGMMWYGIPRYRLPEDALDYDIDAILSLGVEVKYNTKVGVDVSYEELRNTYDSLYLAIGAHTFKDLGIEYATKEGVMSAVEFLHSASSGIHQDLSGKSVVVVGGGNVAMDATRTAKRLGAEKVYCVYRRRIADMTALPEEVESAIAEGCEVVELMSPVRVDKGTTKPLSFVGQPQMASFYRGNRPAPKATSAAEVAYECDLLIEAIGQKVDSAYFAEQGFELQWGSFSSDEYGVAAGQDGVYVGGDSQTGPSTVIRAIAAGKAAAANIDDYLGFDHDVYDDVALHVQPFDSKQPCGRINILERPAAERACDFDGVETSLLTEQAVQECGRCLRCDHYGMGALRGGRPAKW